MFHLNPASIADAVRAVSEYRDRVSDLGDSLTKRLTEDGVKQAKEVARYMNAYDSGELVNGIVPEYREKVGAIHSTAGHSAYVEMGTGVRGKQDPNPNNYAAGWEYDVNEHGEKGWFYLGRDGKRHWTKGMPHRPFMYETAQILREAIPYVAEEELKKKE